MGLVIDEYSLLGTVLVIAIIGGMISKQGGLKIVIWRILGIKWFLFTLRLADGGAIKLALKADKIHYSLPRFDTKYGTFFAGGPEHTVKVFGGPQWVYNYYDARPIPLDQLDQKERFSPDIIGAAFHDETIAKFNMLKQPLGSKFKWGVFGVVIALMFVMVIVSVFYTYYFGVNLNCALHTRVCP